MRKEVIRRIPAKADVLDILGYITLVMNFINLLVSTLSNLLGLTSGQEG